LQQSLIVPSGLQDASGIEALYPVESTASIIRSKVTFPGS
jgi:hypothetical protein